MTMIKQYFEEDSKYTKKYGDKCILLWQCGSFFEVYSLKKNNKFINNKIEEFSRICDMTIANKSAKYKNYSVFMAGFSPIDRIDKYVEKLNEHGFIVPVWIQDEKVKNVRYELGVYTPGTNFNTKSQTNTNSIMCIWLDKKERTLLNKNPTIICGMSCIDVLNGSSYIFQFREDYFHNPTTYDEIERFYSTHNPNEVIFIHNCDNVEEIIQFSSINCETKHLINFTDKESEYYDCIRNCEKQYYQKELLEKIFNINDYSNFYESNKFKEFSFATNSYCFLLDFIYNIQPSIIKKIKEPTFNNNNDRMLLGNHSAKQLNILETTENNRFSSVIKFLNKCKTLMGKRKIKHQILNPITNIRKLNYEYKHIEYTKISFIKYSSVFDYLNGMCDFERLFRKMILFKITPAELVTFYKNLETVKKIDKIILKDKVLKGYFKNQNLSKCYNKICKELKTKLNFKTASCISLMSFEENIFNKGIYEDLDKVIEKKCEYSDKLMTILKYLDSFVSKNENKRTKKTKAKTYIKIHNTEKSGLYLELTTRRSKLLWDEIKNFKKPYILNYFSSFDNTKKSFEFDINELKFITGTSSNKRIDTPFLDQLYRNVNETKYKLREVLKETYKKFIKSFQEFKNEIQENIDFVVNLDVLFTKAKLAIDYNYCCPTIKEDAEKSFINAKKMRHILIEHIQQEEIYVPNDIILGIGEKENDENKQNGILLYGTNAVGKSSLIKSIGICVILAQAGFFVPCESFEYKPYFSIFTRILGNDDIFKGLSTFAVEMSELRTILKMSNENSLVLGDEVCSGTETISALSIFISALMELHKKNTSFIFATHFHELVEMSYLKKMNNINLYHMAVECLNGIIKYDRELRKGSGSNIYGLEVCKSLHMSKSFLKQAHEIRNEIYPEGKNVLQLKKSHYTSRKIKGKCELCGRKGIDIHHMNPQEKADENGFIEHFHKNHPANLMNICKNCHLQVTKKNIVHKRVKTTDGYQLEIV